MSLEVSVALAKIEGAADDGDLGEHFEAKFMCQMLREEMEGEIVKHDPGLEVSNLVISEDPWLSSNPVVRR